MAGSKFGAVLRLSRLDELPQLYNILVGEMSFVGPRPLLVTDHELGTRDRLLVRPGLTGWAQVNGWRGETVTLEQIRRRVDHDLYYIENWSLTFDLLILGWTLFTVLSRENAV